MTDTAPFAYDDVFYPGLAFDQTHPDRLAAIAVLFGMQPALPSRCRVLELGCGVGANLMPMAYQNPESEFLGIDLSAPTIAQGRAQAAAFGLGNIELRTGDILDVNASFGRFDYIVAHGVYSWVPEPVRARVLDIFAECLAPQGVGFVSYNAYPGSHLRDLGRRMMHFHVRSMDDAAAQVRQGRALLRFLAEATDAEEVYGAAVREALARASEKSDEVLYHDDLNAGARAFLFHEVAAAAERAGLQYLGESTLARSAFGTLPEFARPLIESIPAQDVVAREQYLDFLTGRWFRETLFCRAEVPLARELTPQALSGLHISADLRPEAADPPAAQAGQATFNSPRGDALVVEEPLTRAALQHLAKIWPRAAAFPALVRAAGEILVREGDAQALGPQPVEMLATTLLGAYRSNLLYLHAEPPGLSEVAGARPLASELARRQAEGGPIVTNLRHAPIKLDGALHPFLMLLDGSRSTDELAPELERLLAEGAQGEEAAGFTPADSQQAAVARAAEALDALAKMGLILR
jgi:SAM-dependent methyltransferase